LDNITPRDEAHETYNSPENVDVSAKKVALTKKLTEAQGGRIAIENDHGNGSTLLVNLPTVIPKVKSHE
jgi:light-regulated signal transduction histidine kinase (bacteriophytochrome)